MSNLPDAVVERIAVEVGKAAAAYRGKIKAVNTTTNVATVTTAAGDVASVRWLLSYTPVVNDLVLLLRVESEWVVLGKLGVDPTPTPVIATVTVVPQSVWRVRHRKDPSESWSWWISSLYAQGGEVGADGYYAEQGSLATIVLPTFPAGATITSAKLRITRWNTGLSLVTPEIYGHTITGTPTGAIASYLPATYGPWLPGDLTVGQTAYWDLPSGWTTALAAGTLKGFGVWANTLAAHARFDPATFCELTITYTYTP